MKTIIRMMAFIFIMTLFTACSREPFAPVGGGFSIQMPGTPEEQAQVLDTPAGKIKLNLYHCKSGKWEYLAGYSDYEKLGAGVEQVLDGVRDGALKGSNTRLLSETVISQDGHPGRELRMEGQQGTAMRFKIVLVGTRLYQVGVVTPTEDAESSKIAEYLKSFRLKKPGS